LLPTFFTCNLTKLPLHAAQIDSRIESQELRNARAAFENQQYDLARNHYELAYYLLAVRGIDPHRDPLTAAHIWTQIGRLEARLGNSVGAIGAINQALSVSMDDDGKTVFHFGSQDETDLRDLEKSLAEMNLPDFQKIRVPYEGQLKRCVSPRSAAAARDGLEVVRGFVGRHDGGQGSDYGQPKDAGDAGLGFNERPTSIGWSCCLSSKARKLRRGSSLTSSAPNPTSEMRPVEPT
jgi:hypothetical protein